MGHSFAGIDFSLTGPYRTLSSCAGTCFGRSAAIRWRWSGVDDGRHDDSSCFADEVAIDFPSVAPAVDRMRRAFIADERRRGAARGDHPVFARGTRGNDGPAGGSGPLHVPYLRRARRNVDRIVPPVPRQRRRAASPPAAGAGAGRRHRRHALLLHRDPASPSPDPDRAAGSRRLTAVERHVTVLGILTSLWGALAMLVGVALLFLSAGALAILAGPDGDTRRVRRGIDGRHVRRTGRVSLLWGGATSGPACCCGAATRLDAS